MPHILNYDASTVMRRGFPKITKLGAVSPYGESTPFVFNGRLYRLELCDPSRGTRRTESICALIRDRETFDDMVNHTHVPDRLKN